MRVTAFTRPILKVMTRNIERRVAKIGIILTVPHRV
jgi:hypothetical protein